MGGTVPVAVEGAGGRVEEGYPDQVVHRVEGRVEGGREPVEGEDVEGRPDDDGGGVQTVQELLQRG